MEVLQKIEAVLRLAEAEGNVPALTPPQIARLQALALLVAQTAEEEYSCEQVYELADQYAELLLQGEDGAILMPQVKHHLEICGDCCQEFELLLQILQMGI